MAPFQEKPDLPDLLREVKDSLELKAVGCKRRFFSAGEIHRIHHNLARGLGCRADPCNLR